ncbi:MAG: TerB family tellurite resistance protein [Bacteroidota bacterium]
MAISDLYMSVGQKRNISHFANIVRIAKSDKILTKEEVALLEKIAIRYNIGNGKFKEIYKNPEKFPTIAHIECEERIERLFDLIKMVEADHTVDVKEVSVLRKIVTGLAFPTKNVNAIVAKATEIDIENCELEAFQKEILKVNKF